MKKQTPVQRRPVVTQPTETKQVPFRFWPAFGWTLAILLGLAFPWRIIFPGRDIFGEFVRFSYAVGPEIVFLFITAVMYSKWRKAWLTVVIPTAPWILWLVWVMIRYSDAFGIMIAAAVFIMSGALPSGPLAGLALHAHGRPWFKKYRIVMVCLVAAIILNQGVSVWKVPARFSDTDPARCRQMQKNEDQATDDLNLCYRDVARTANDTNICDTYFSSGSEEWNECYIWVADRNYRFDLCTNLPPSSQQAECVKNKIVTDLDDAACDTIDASQVEWREKCHTEIWLRQHRPATDTMTTQLRFWCNLASGLNADILNDGFFEGLGAQCNRVAYEEIAPFSSAAAIQAALDARLDRSTVQ